MRPASPNGARGTIALAAAALAGAALTGSAYWPGLMPWDAVHQYDQALNDDISDWHPPSMQWLWQRLIPVHGGPAPMLLIQLALFWGGLCLIAAAVWRGGRQRTAWGVLTCGLLPIDLALIGAVLKDCLMAGILLVVVGLIAWNGGQRRLWRALLAGALLFCAATLRFNAFIACLPLLLALLPPAWLARWRAVAAILIGTLALTAAMPVANRLIGAEKTKVGLSLVIFDLGGITEQSGVDVFPAQMGVADPVRVNHGCYRADKWDSYSYWVDPECPLGFNRWVAVITPTGADPNRLWLGAVLSHPFAYAAHRLHHFAINTRLLPIADDVERPVPIAAPNDWGIHVTPNARWATIDRLALLTAHTPLGWPIVWIALALGAVIAGWAAEGRRLIVPIAASAFLYGMGYLAFSVAAELRYHVWTGIAALIATVLVVSEARTLLRRRLMVAYLPTLVVLLACFATRL